MMTLTASLRARHPARRAEGRSARMPGVSADQHALDAPGHEGAVLHHLADDHGEDHGHDDHAHAEEPLGPIDLAAWGAVVLGVAIALAIAACFALATS
jgi:hypothetical protein